MDKWMNLFFIIIGLFFLINYRYLGARSVDSNNKTARAFGFKTNVGEGDYKLAQFSFLIIGIIFTIAGILSFFGVIKHS